MTAANPQRLPMTLFFGLLATSESLFSEAERILAKEYSPIRERSATLDFIHTDYYTREMGGPILRRWVAVDIMIEPNRLTGVKNHTNRMEGIWTREVDGEKCRSVNIDPGYLDLCRVVLASCKDRDHRIYLNDGVFAETTLTYKSASKRYEPLPWTYADYQTPEAQALFLSLRATHRQRAEAWQPVIR